MTYILSWYRCLIFFNILSVLFFLGHPVHCIDMSFSDSSAKKLHSLSMLTPGQTGPFLGYWYKELTNTIMTKCYWYACMGHQSCLISASAGPCQLTNVVWTTNICLEGSTQDRSKSDMTISAVKRCTGVWDKITRFFYIFNIASSFLVNICRCLLVTL